MSAIYSDYQIATVTPPPTTGKMPGNYTAVTTLLQQGYIPVGGVSIDSNFVGRQVMVKPTGTLRGGARRTRGTTKRKGARGRR